MKIIICTFFLSFFSYQQYAQDCFMIKDVKLFDGETLITKTSVRVENGKIVAVSEEMEFTENCEVIQANGKTLIPALPNAHVHAWMPNSLKEAAKAGVLNVFDMHGFEPYQTSMRQLKDSTNYARYYVAGYAATAPEGHGTQFGFPVPTLAAPGDAKGFIADRVKANVDYIKIIVEPWKPTLSSEINSDLIQEAHQQQKIAVVHVSQLKDAIDVVQNDADGIVHIWWDSPIEAEKLNEIASENDFFVIPTLLTTLKVFELMEEEAEEYMSKEELLAQIKQLHDAGIPLLAGTDPPNANINYGTDLYQELHLLKEAGLSNIEVLKTATSNVALQFGIEQSGFIKREFTADLLLINGDPTQNLDDLANIEKIWKAGKEVSR